MTISNFFIPNRQTVSDITQANPGVVTTSQDHGYSTGLLVEFFMPLNVGMNQLNDAVVTITVLSSNTFSIGLDTRNFDAFSLGSTVQTPQVIPIGSFQSAIIDPTDNNGNIVPEF